MNPLRWLATASGRGPMRQCTPPYVVPVIRDNRAVWELRVDVRRWFTFRVVALAACDTPEQAFTLARHRDQPVFFSRRGADGKTEFFTVLNFTLNFEVPSQGDDHVDR